MSLIAEVVAALNAARKTADDTRLAVTQVAGYAERCAQLYAHASRGTSHPEAQAAVTQMQAAQHRTNLLMAYVSKGVVALDEYVRDIAPALADGGGSGGGRPSPVSGEAFLKGSSERLDRNFKGFANRLVRDAENVKDLTEQVTKDVSKGLSFKKALDRSPGPAQTGTTGQVMVHNPPETQMSATDITTGLAIAVIVLTKSVQVGVDKLIKQIGEWKHGK